MPDTETADALIHDKLAGIDWGEQLGDPDSTFVNAATFSLMLTGQVLRGGSRDDAGFANALRRAVGRLGEPVIRQATLQAMRILGGQFVFGRTIDEALKRAAPEQKRGLTHCFDMLGEAAMTFADAERYRRSYAAAIARLAREANGGVRASPGISVKLSALYPRYDFLHAEAAKAALVPIVRELALAARAADIHFTIDAEEAERLELSLDIIEALVADDALFEGGWEGFGLALQAYQKRAVPLVRLGRRARPQAQPAADGPAGQGRLLGQRDQARARSAAIADYPVFTRKVATDVSYLACAAKLLAAEDAIYPAFATHNAYTIGAIKALAAGREFEFQRLHGMGEDVYEVLAEAEGDRPTRVRIYAPVGGHKDLLAYLVRRLLENGANSSFVNRMADADVPVGRTGDQSGRRPRRARAEAQSVDPAPGRHLPQPPQQRRGRPGRPDGARTAAGRVTQPRNARLGRHADRARGSVDKLRTSGSGKGPESAAAPKSPNLPTPLMTSLPKHARSARRRTTGW